MRTKAMMVVSAVLATAAVCVPREAFALGPVDVEVGAKVGGGTNPFDQGPNPLGLGVGARGGIAFAGFYGGLQFMYYFGSSQNIVGQNVSEKALTYGIEGGFGIPLLKFFTLRGVLGLGNFQINTSGDFSGNAGHLYLEPQAVLLASIGMIFVGVDASVLVLPDAADPSLSGGTSWRAAFTAHVQGGITF